MNHLIIDVVLYKTDYWNVGIKVGGKFSFIKYDDKSVGIDPNAPTIMGMTWLNPF